MTVFSGGANVSDTVTIASLSSIVNGAYSAPSTLVDNTPSNGRGFSYLRGLLRLSFSGALTAGAGSPYVAMFRHHAADGTNLPSPPGTSAVAPSANSLQSIRQLVASATFQVIDLGPFDLDSFLYGLQVFNGSGVNFSGTVTATLYRWNTIGV